MLRRLRQSSHLVKRMAHGGRRPNRLGNERSPYLLQHAHNPVAWYPWGEEAFQAARKKNKLIFLSIGYSTCHWCHVMERESFENDEVADILNEHFVSIKVDREERPDIDKIYMTYVQLTTGSGGWPLSVWLTPSLKPIFGGTYFPPEDDQYGRYGFKTILRKLNARWRSQDTDKLVESADRTAESLARASNFKMNEQAADSFEVSHVVEKCYSMLKENFEDLGYRHEPKFPQCVIGNFLLNLYYFNQDLSALVLVHKHLRAMATGGIHDHLAGGFHRYSVDSKWHVPHFEKMLYDQAQLLGLYSTFTKAVPIVKKGEINFIQATAKGIAEYVCRDLSHPEGGFYSAEDADSFESFEESGHKKEGAFYVWTLQEIQEVLSEQEAKVFCEFFSVEDQGNVEPHSDPHGELLNQNVLLYRYRDWVDFNSSDIAKIFDIDSDVDIDVVLESAKSKLLQRRLQTRPRPHLDNKIVTAWNGLMIAGMAKASRFLDNPQYADRATKAVDFIRNYLYNARDRTLLRSVYTEGEGENAEVRQLATPIQGVVDDYASLIHGLLELYDATLDESHLLFAKDLQDSQNRLFWDDENGGYFLSPDTISDIIYKIKDDQDGAEPSANSLSVGNLVRLAAIFDNEEFRRKSSMTIKLFAERLNKVPMILPEMVSSLLWHSNEPTKVILSSLNEDVSLLKAHCDSEVRPFLIVHKAKKNSSVGANINDYPPIDGKVTAYVCKDFSCKPPVTDPDDLLRLLSK